MGRIASARASVLQPPLPSRVSSALSRYRMGGRRNRAVRRAVAVILLLTAGALALAPPDAALGTAVLTAARNLPVGAVLTAGDLRTAVVTAPPDGVLRAADAQATVGQVLAGPVRRGETLTDARILSDQGPDPGPGRIALPITAVDAAVRALLRPGMRITLVGVTGGSSDGLDDHVAVRTSPLTSEAVVLAVPAETTGQHASTVIVSVPEAVASAVTTASVADALLVQFGP